MIRRRTPLRSLALPVAVALLGLAGCGEDGVTPDCPELPLYDASDPDVLDDPEIRAARQAAIDAGCLTDLGEPAPPPN